MFTSDWKIEHYIGSESFFRPSQRIEVSLFPNLHTFFCQFLSFIDM